MNRNGVLQNKFEPERRSGAFRLNSTTVKDMVVAGGLVNFKLAIRVNEKNLYAILRSTTVIFRNIADKLFQINSIHLNIPLNFKKFNVKYTQINS
jgi:hypothetical protein